MASNTNSLALVAASSQYASVADNAGLSPTGSITVEAYVNFTSTPSSGSDMAILSKYRDDNSQVSWVFSLHNNGGTLKISMATSTNGTNFERSEVNWTPSTSTWYHVAAVVDYTGSAVARFFIDGVQQGSDQAKAHTTIFDSTTALQLGVINVGGTPSAFFNGLIDEARFWSGVRSAAQILANKQVDVTGQSNLLGYWKLNNDYTDASGNGNTLTASGSPVFSSTVPFATYVTTNTGGSFLLNFI